MKIIFVGLHNKENMKPLDSKTKSGKLIDRIIKLIPNGYDVIKSNMFNVNQMPHPENYYNLVYDWVEEYNPTSNDIIVLLGNFVHKHFFPFPDQTIKIAHPASIRSNLKMNEYINEASSKIIDSIKAKEGVKMNELNRIISILNRNQNTIKAMEEYGNQRFIEGKKEGISETVNACTIMVIGSVCFIEEHESRIKIVMKKVKDELLSKL